MSKKHKANKPLPSALTVARPVKHAPEPSQARSSRAFSTADEAANPPASKPMSRPTPETPPLKPSASMLSAAFPQNVVEEKKAPLPKAPRALNTTFALLEPHANRVQLSGGFNAWSPEVTPLKRQADGHWETTLALPPGRYEYKFVVDGHWIPDPHSKENVLNPHGTLNSVIEVRA